MSEELLLRSFSWVTAVPLLLFWLMLCLLEIRRKNRKNLAFRLFLISLVTLSIAGLLWKPAILRDKPAGQIILVGEMTPVRQLDSLKSAIPGADIISADTLFEPLQASQVYMTGQGIHAGDLWKRGNAVVTLLPDTTPAGIIDLDLPDEATTGDTLHISGKYYGADSVRLKLLLNSHVADSAVTDTSGGFAFSHIPPVAGPLVYTIEAVHADMTELYTAGVYVRENTPAKAAIFLSYPSFEARELKEYLAENGMEVLVRQRISRDKFSYEFLNTAERQAIAPGTALFQEMSLVVADQQFLDDLPVSLFNELENAVRDGLGLLILPSQKKAGRGALFVDLEEMQDGFAVRSAPGVVEATKNGTILMSGGKQFGKGLMAVSGNTTTYAWRLEGENARYEQYWTVLIRLALRRNDKVITDMPWPIRENESAQITIAAKSAPTVFWDQQRQSPASDIYMENEWKISVWPEKTGWHQLIAASDTTRVYIYAPEEWQSLRFYRQKMLIRQLEKGSQEEKMSSVGYYAPVSPWLFLVVILICSALLWIEGKFL